MTVHTKSLKGTWAQAIGTFLFPLLLVFSLRWMIVEPFVIPSGSMIPNLLIHDHILVKKFSLGIKVPFSNHWLVRWRDPKRGEVLVFRFPENPEVFYVKRLIGLPGDRIVITNGQVKINDQPWPLKPLNEDTPTPGFSKEPGFEYFFENTGTSSHIVRFYKYPGSLDEDKEIVVPEGHYFFMGDNRDQSSDGRVWGFVPEKYLVGPASVVWLSCENTLTSASYLCDPRQIRWKRLFNSVQ